MRCAPCCSNGPSAPPLLILQKGRDDARINELMKLAQAKGIKTELRDSKELDRLAGDERHQGACLQIRSVGVLGEGALDDLLDLDLDTTAAPGAGRRAGSPHDLGACLRTADAAGVTAVIVPKDRAAGLSATVRKAASGAAETVPLIQVTNLARTLRWLKEREIWIVGTDDQAEHSLYASKLDRPAGRCARRGRHRATSAHARELRRAGQHSDAWRRGKLECFRR